MLGLPTRIGPEDTTVGPDGSTVDGNTELVRLALQIWTASEHHDYRHRGHTSGHAVLRRTTVAKPGARRDHRAGQLPRGRLGAFSGNSSKLGR